MHTTGRPQRAPQIPLWIAALAAAVVLVAMQPYYFGYRLSGDDIWFTQLAAQGFNSVSSNALYVAKEQGRIGQLLMLPLNVFGALIAGNPWGRAAILAAYGLQLLLFSVFVARLLRRAIWPFLFLLLVVLHPLTFAFMPPNAYPLQNTVPFLMILVARMVVLHEREKAAPSRLRVTVAQVAFALGMFVSEFAVAFGTALLIAEYLARAGAARLAGRMWAQALRTAFAPRFLVSDGLAVLAVLVPYGLFRLAFPGMYEGNSAAGLSAPLRIAGTVFGHIRDGMAFPRLGGGLSSAMPLELLVAGALGVAAGVCFYRLAQPVRDMCLPGAVIVASLLLAVYVSLPVAISAKYQDACMDRGACAYVDSRISYLFASVAALGAVAIVCRLASRRDALLAVCVALGVMASLVSVYNAGKAREMRLVHAVWQRADVVACSGEAYADETELTAAIDPQGFIVITPPGRVADFWKVYVPWRARMICPARS